MTEAEYLAGVSPGPMLMHLRRRAEVGGPAAKARRWRLLAVALGRRFRPAGQAEPFAALLDHVERVAEGAARLADARPVLAGPLELNEWGHLPPGHPAAVSVALCDPEAYRSAYDTAGQVGWNAAWMDGRVPSAVCCGLVRCLFGNPFRPVRFDPAWQTPAVLAVAQGCYAGRAFDRLPVLADALEDAGCDAPDLLAHLRGPGPHARGCRPLDLVLGHA